MPPEGQRKILRVLGDIFELKYIFFYQKAARRAAKFLGYFGRQILGAESTKSTKRQIFGLEKKNYNQIQRRKPSKTLQKHRKISILKGER